jgi:hypothetical protein
VENVAFNSNKLLIAPSFFLSLHTEQKVAWDRDFEEDEFYEKKSLLWNVLK